MTLRLVAPMAGWVGPLGALPDPAFAEGMVGDGVALDPVGTTLHAPCDGLVAAIHRSRHAITLRAEGGAEILCHVGIETVRLDGAGFAPRVAEGDRVVAGAPLLDFDLDVLAARASSLASPIVVIDGEAFRVVRRAVDARVAVGDWLMDVEATAAPAAVASTSDAPMLSRAVTLPPGHGVHARPAAAIVACARRFDVEVTIVTERATAPATSAVALMTLGLAGGDRATVKARGREAAAALDALARLIEHGLDGEASAAPPPPLVPSQSLMVLEPLNLRYTQ